MFQGAAMFPTALRPEPFHAPLEHYLHSHKGIHIGRDGSVIRVGEGIYDIMHRRFSRAIHFDDSLGYWFEGFDGPISVYEVVGEDPYGFIQTFVRCNACSARSEKSISCKGTTKTKGGTTLLIASWPGSSVKVVIFARANFPRFLQRQLGVTHRHPQLRRRLRGRRGILRTWMRNPQARNRISACGGAAGAGAGTGAGTVRRRSRGPA